VRHRIIGELACLEDAPLALAEHGERFAKRLLAVVRLSSSTSRVSLIGDFVDQPVLPFAGIAS